MLEKVASLSPEEAKAQMIEAVKAEAHTDAIAQSKIIIEEAKLNATKDAKRLVLQTIQRTLCNLPMSISKTEFRNSTKSSKSIGFFHKVLYCLVQKET